MANEAPILLRTRDVMRLVGLSRTRLHELRKAGEFPPARRVGARTVAWLRTDVEAWAENLHLAE